MISEEVARMATTATVELIKGVAQVVQPIDPIHERDCFSLTPPVPVIERVTGKTVHVRLVYGSEGRYPNRIHLEEKLQWWEIEAFDLPSSSD